MGLTYGAFPFIQAMPRSEGGTHVPGMAATSYTSSVPQRNVVDSLGVRIPVDSWLSGWGCGSMPKGAIHTGHNKNSHDTPV